VFTDLHVVYHASPCKTSLFIHYCIYTYVCLHTSYAHFVNTDRSHVCEHILTKRLKVKFMSVYMFVCINHRFVSRVCLRQTQTEKMELKFDMYASYM
jgi:hypothetical protein